MRRLVTLGLVVLLSMTLAFTTIAYASSSTHSADLAQQKPPRADSAAGHTAAPGISHGKGIDRPAVKRSPRRLDRPSASHGAPTSTASKTKVRVGGSVATSSIATATPELQANAPAANAPLLGGTFNGATQCCGSCGLGAFFTNAVAGLFDPWLVYDQYINRYWFLTVSENDSPQNSDF